MAISHAKDASASTASAEPKISTVAEPKISTATMSSTTQTTTTLTGAAFIPPESRSAGPEYVRHMLFGTASAVQTTIRRLHKLGYAEPNDWSRLIATGRASEVMSILTKRVEAS